jgi:alpha-methylacyl-CoA racemase
MGAGVGAASVAAIATTPTAPIAAQHIWPLTGRRANRYGRGMAEQARSGPLAGLRVVEIASLAPAPFAVTMLADLGADVVRIDRPARATPTTGPSTSADVGTDHARADAAARPPTSGRGGPTRSATVPTLSRSRRSVAIDLKDPSAAEQVLSLTDRADVLVEGFRPGVCERLGIGPDVACARNPRLVYGRMTGWGQDGPMAQRAGHDLTYLALSGALHPLGPAGQPPIPPLNYVADFGGGGMLLAMGVVAALVERERSGKGQVVDAAMVEGAGLMTLLLHGLRAGGMWSDERGTNLLDGSAPFYTTYRCADDNWLAVAALEPEFYAQLLDGLEIADVDLPAQYDPAGWPRLRTVLSAAVATRTRDEWAAVFAGRDACAAPVLSPAEAAGHPHLAARGSFTDVAGLVQPAPAPRFSRTPSPLPTPAPGQPGGPAPCSVADVLASWA